MTPASKPHREQLREIAEKAMVARGLLPDYSPEALAELAKLQPPTADGQEAVRDFAQSTLGLDR